MKTAIKDRKREGNRKGKGTMSRPEQLSPGEREGILPLYRGSQETLIWSCLQGVMGEAWADDRKAPRCALICLGDFCYPAGDADAPGAAELLRILPARRLFVVPESEAWSGLIERLYKDRCRRLDRYAIKKEPGIFARETLWGFVRALPPGFYLEEIGSRWYDSVMAEEWSRDFCSNFGSKEDFAGRGLGFLALRNGVPVSGASSYSVYRGGLEIEVVTHPDYRRQGLAAACAARLILECLDRGLYPSWDAANQTSVRLSERLGYHFDRAYPTYEILTT